MTNEELEKAMQFVLEQQTQFVANQQQMSERVSRLETNMEFIVQAQADTSQALVQLAQEQARMAQTQTHMNEVVAALYEAQRHTEEKLDAFIGVLERYISEDRNGKGNGDRTN
jgi:uncharacterized protein YoxC